MTQISETANVPSAGIPFADLPSDAELIELAQARALALLEASLADTSRAEARSAKRLSRLLADEAGRDLLLDLTDQVLRIRNAKRSARRLADLTAQGVPASLGGFDRFGLASLGKVARLIPGITEKAVDWRIAKDTAGVILPSEDPAFSKYVHNRKSDGFSLNINVLGESILGDDEARERTNMVRTRIQRSDVNYVSVKISAICANLDVLAKHESLERIEQRLIDLYSAAAATTPQTFVNLDMEEYRDLELSVEAFMHVLSKQEFTNLRAGIVLQAYIPDSHDALLTLINWANERYRNGGAPIKIRLVKGANLAMEFVEAELHDWPQAPYPSKHDVDASYKAMLETVLTKSDRGAVRVGVASHNLFEVAWALTLRDLLGAHDIMEIEMLEGMAPPQSRAVRNDAGELLLYSPVVAKEDRDASIAYLSRRLDENSAPENFLRALFDITPGSPEWDRQSEWFRNSVRERHTVTKKSRRVQDRGNQLIRYPVDGTFVPSIDSDFTLPANREWVARAFESTIIPTPEIIDSIDQVDAAVARAHAAQQEWQSMSFAARRVVLAQIAEVMEKRRGQTLVVMAKTVGKTVREGDPEISEAIDFANYAAHSTLAHQDAIDSGLTWTPHRLVLVAGPWNFPAAIPNNGLVSAIAAGSAAILKPAPEARAVAAELVDQLHEAGVPEGLVQLLCTPDNEVGKHLVTHPGVDMVMLTGSLETAQMFQSWKPTMHLNAETSGKNAMVITAAADIDQAIKELVKSAFGHAGQKCSAASLAIIEASVYDDPNFHERIADAVRSLTVGDATDFNNIVGPIINAPTGNLKRALTTLEPGEKWLVEPQMINDNIFTPGVRKDVAPNSWFHLTECFGPVLGLMRARDLDHAIELQNASIYGLTGGIQSLDPKEIELWLSKVQVGNAYVNRHITGAIVERQPFGGWKKSSIGPGMKPGGPNHLSGYGNWTQQVIDPKLAAVDYQHEWDNYFSLEHDPTGLKSEANILRYFPLDKVFVRCSDPTAPEIDLLRAASRVTGVPLEISVRSDESEAALGNRLGRACGDVRLRILAPATDELYELANHHGITVDTARVTAKGRIELAHWVKEQAVSRTMHRYGRLLNKF
jgi:RHH-type transcriptional regulator, proline utilization regulon repressor / proline dehydrogenase / delta 1-pyrroline-5-carboxylate dehydrogenase